MSVETPFDRRKPQESCGNIPVGRTSFPRMRLSSAPSLAPLLVVTLALVVACEKKQAGEAPAAAAAPAPEAPKDAAHARGKGGGPTTANVESVEAPEVAIRKDGTTVHVRWNAPKGTAVNDDAPFKVRWKNSEGLAEAPPEMKSTGANVKDGFDVKVVPLSGAPRATLDGHVDLVVCDVATHAVCVPVKRKLDLGFIVTKDAPAETKLDVNLPEAKSTTL